MKKLSAEEQIQQKDIIAKKLMDKFDSEIKESIGNILQHGYWSGWNDGYHYRKAEEKLEKGED